MSLPDRTEGTAPIEFPFTHAQIKAASCSYFGYNPEDLLFGLPPVPYMNPKYRVEQESSVVLINKKPYRATTQRVFDGARLVAEIADYFSDRPGTYNRVKMAYAVEGRDIQGRRVRVSAREHSDSPPKVAAQIERDPKVGLEFANRSEIEDIARAVGLA